MQQLNLEQLKYAETALMKTAAEEMLHALAAQAAQENHVEAMDAADIVEHCRMVHAQAEKPAQAEAVYAHQAVLQEQYNAPLEQHIRHALIMTATDAMNLEELLQIVLLQTHAQQSEILEQNIRGHAHPIHAK